MSQCFSFYNGSGGLRKTTKSTFYYGVVALALCLGNGRFAQAQPNMLPSHGKIKLDSYNHLLRDVHPASQAQANYLQNRLFASGLKKAERTERKERLDTYDERQLIYELEDYQSVTRSLGAGRPSSARSLPTFWMLVSAFGDHAEVYEALASELPPLSTDEFRPTSQFMRIVQPNGELAPLPLLLGEAEDLDASGFQAAWATVREDLQTTGEPTAQDVATFRKAVSDYLEQWGNVVHAESRHTGRFHAKRYVVSLKSLADALYRPHQCAQIHQYLEQGGYACCGDNVLELIQHVLRHRITPTQGSRAQLALAEVARPIDRALEQEIALRYERIDSLAAGEGHRPYAAEYRAHVDPASTMPNVRISKWTP